MATVATFAFNPQAWGTLKEAFERPDALIPGLDKDTLARFLAKGHLTVFGNGSAVIEWRGVDDWDARLRPRKPEHEFFERICSRMAAGGEYMWTVIGDSPHHFFYSASYNAGTCPDTPKLELQRSVKVTPPATSQAFETCEQVLGFLERHGKFPDGFGDDPNDWYLEDKKLGLAVPLAAARYRLLPFDSDMWDYNINGTTPSHIGAKYGYLPDGFSDWTLEDEDGTTVAHVAAEWGELPEDFDQWDIGAKTWIPVAHWAAEHGTIPRHFPKELWYMQDKKGRTVAQVAHEWGNLPEGVDLYGPDDIGTLWWNADNEDEAKQWVQDYTAKGASNFKLMDPDPETGVIGVTFDLPKAKAQEILGYTPDEEEWLVKEDEPVATPKMGM